MITLKSLILLLTKLGLPVGAATALAVLILEESPLGLNELAEKTGYAKSHLSIYLRTLASKGLVNVKRSGRRIYYYASHSALVKLLKEHFETVHAGLSSLIHSINDNEARQYLMKLLEGVNKLMYNIHNLDKEGR